MKRALLLLLFSFTALAIEGSVQCPIDNTYMWFTGETRVDNGKLLKKYKCPRGHEVWIIPKL